MPRPYEIMGLFTKTIGSGPSIVLLHGWGWHSDIWFPVVESLSQHYSVTLIDLPGFGRSASVKSYDLSTVIPDDSTCIGWSLGAVIANHLAYYHPKKITKLITVTSAEKINHIESFSLDSNLKQMLTRFLLLQLHGLDDPKHYYRSLKPLLFKHGIPAAQALQAGLDLLKIPQMKSVSCPSLQIYGEFDTLVPPDNAQGVVIKGATHIPFVTHTQEFLDIVLPVIARSAMTGGEFINESCYVV